MITSGMALLSSILIYIGGQISESHKNHVASQQQKVELMKDLCFGEQHDCDPLKEYLRSK